MYISADLKNDQDTRGIPFVFLTAVINRKEVEKRRDIIGRERYVSKPINMNELLSIIDELGPAATTETKQKTTTVTFLSRNQIDFLDKLGKDSVLYYGFKLSRGKILSELVDFLMELGIDIKETNLNEESLAGEILKASDDYCRNKKTDDKNI